MSSTTTFRRVLWGLAVVELAMAPAIAAIATLVAMTLAARDDRPALPKEPPEAPLIFAHTERVCFPMFTVEERLTTFELCERDQGEIVFGHDFVECWRGEPYEDRSVKLWTREAKEAR